MIHAKSESDVASYAASSSPASPKRPVYFVQSPSRDSHDDVDKSSSSVQATPNYHSPLESPSHPSSSFGRHSRSSSSSRVSGNWRWARGNRRRSGKGWQECNVIEEEAGFDDILYGDKGLTARGKCLFAVMGIGAVFAVFCLIIWGASRPYGVRISMKSLKVHNFYFGQGADGTGVPTKLLTVNCSVRMVIYNPASFFGIHVSSNPVSLIYTELTVATGQLKKYYQPRKSRRVMSVNLEGKRVPLYGAGATLSALDVNEVPMKLDFELQSRGNLVGKLVKTKYTRQISCSLVINSRSTKEIKLKPDSCTHD